MQNVDNEVRVSVLFFGAARDAVGHDAVDFVLPTATTATEALAEVLEKYPELHRFGRSLLFAVNQEYARGDRLIMNGDELAVFPPVSGGRQPETSSRGAEVETVSAEAERADAGSAGKRGPQRGSPDGVLVLPAPTFARDFFELTTEPIDVGSVARRVILPECGATVTLDGYAREWTRGRRTLFLVYEAYAPMALSELQRLAREAHEQFEIAHIGVVHRTGRLEIGETSVVISVSAAHRRAAFEACEWAIRELKRTVPIWKKEVFEDGEIWVEGEGALRD